MERENCETCPGETDVTSDLRDEKMNALGWNPPAALTTSPQSRALNISGPAENKAGC